MNATCSSACANQPTSDDPETTKSSDERYIDDPNFKRSPNRMARFVTKLGTEIFLPPEIALHPRLFDQVMEGV